MDTNAPGAAAYDSDEDDEQKELREYMDELWERIPAYARRAASIEPGARESVEWYAEIGKFWRDARERSALDRREAARRMEVHINHIRFLEVGVAGDEELDDDFISNYALALGQPDLKLTFNEKFRFK